MNKGQKYLRSGWVAVLLLTVLLWAKAAKADSIVSLDTSISDSGTSDWIVSDGLDGWFFNPDSPQPLPAELNPSDPWTSASNIDTLNYWLSLVLDLGEESDSSQPVVLYGSGTIGSPDPSVPVIQISQVSTQDLVSQTNSEELVSGAPEPVTLWLLAGGLALLGLKRSRVAIIDHGPL